MTYLRVLLEDLEPISASSQSCVRPLVTTVQYILSSKFCLAQSCMLPQQVSFGQIFFTVTRHQPQAP